MTPVYANDPQPEPAKAATTAAETGGADDPFDMEAFEADIVLANEKMGEEIVRLRGVLETIAQYDPRWTGLHVNNAPSRQQLIERAYDALPHTGHADA